MLFRSKLLPGYCFPLGELGGDMCSFKGLQGLPYITIVHGVDVLEEGNKGDELFVFNIAFPFRKYYGIFGLVLCVGGLGI